MSVTFNEVALVLFLTKAGRQPRSLSFFLSAHFSLTNKIIQAIVFA